MSKEIVVGQQAVIVPRSRDGDPDESPPLVNTVRVLENGPLDVRAALTINGAAAGYRATLCRCGHSKNKPYCDDSHAGAGFSASGEPAAKDSDPLAERGGNVDVKVRPNGPLKVVGPVELISSTGHTINRGQEFILCRCGQSKDKPYCDGSHRTVGFTAG